MDDGLFQLLFFGVLILASIFDAATRRRRRRQKMQDMEVEESAEPPADSEVYGEDITIEPPDVRQPTAPGPGRERETADSMVPADLWAILTGPDPVPTGSRDSDVSEQAERPTHLPRQTGAPKSRPEPTPWSTSPSETTLPPPAPVALRATRQRMSAPASVHRAPTWIAGARTGGAALPYVQLLRGGGPDALRSAVVLSEVLGTPVAFRPLGWDEMGP